MKKQHLLTFLCLCLLAIACVGIMSGCSLFGAKCEISWMVEFDKETSENAIITVEGYDKLPSEIPTGEEITVNIDGINGYMVYRVKVNNRKISANESGKYVFTVTESTEVEITLREKVKSIKMPDLTFYAGEKIDRKAIEAEIIYETGRSEKTNKYTVVYQSEEADAFVLGDTHYFVKVSADRANAYKIDMNQPVVCKGVIDPHGGVITDDYLDALKANTEISNVKREESGAISFVFSAPLTTAIVLPSSAQISKGEGTDFIFQKWSATIPANTDKSVTTYAVYKSTLVNVSSVKLEMKAIDGANVPCLIINGNFVAATNVYLYLCETNKGVELDGTAVGGDNTVQGDSFELIFDLRKINDKEYIGAWMDIKLRAEVNGYIETQEINLTEHADVLVDLNTALSYDGYKYMFKTYANCLKVESSEYHDYTITTGFDDNGNPIVIIKGNVAESYAGNIAKLDIEYDINGGTKRLDAKYDEIDELGAYTVTLSLADIPLGHNAYIHFYVLDSLEEENVIFVGKENNLLNEWCSNDNLTLSYNGIGRIIAGGIKVANEDQSAVYYIGKGQWGGITIFGRDDRQFSYSRNSAEIYLENNQIKIAILGNYACAKAEMEAEIALWVCDLQQNPIAAAGESNGPWNTYVQNATATVNDDGTFKIVIDVTDIGWSGTAYSKQCYTFHLGREGEGSNGQNPDLKLDGNLGNATVTLSGKNYTLTSVPGASTGADFWGCLGLTITQ